MNLVKISLFFLFTISAVNSAKILAAFPFPSKSHVILGTALLKELANRGHEVTMISAFPVDPPIKNYNDVVLNDVIKLKYEKLSSTMSPNITIWDRINVGVNMLGWAYDSIMNDPNMIKFLESNEKFDVVIMNWFVLEALTGLAHKVEAPVIAFSIVGNSPLTNYLFNVPAPISYVPTLFLPYTDDMNFIERTYNAISTFLFNSIYSMVYLPLQRYYLKQYFPEAPPLDELLDNIDIALLCSHFATETPRPGFPNLIQIGGFHLYEKEDLSKELETYLNQSRNGVVLFSLGTNVKAENMPVGAMDIFISAFGKLKYDILWKSNVEIKNLPKNVKITKWLPQRAVLAHPNLKAFITHGGYGSTVEAIYNGIPMVGLPFFGDQLKNVAQCENKGIAIHLDVEKLTETNVTKAVNEIIENPIYKKNIEFHSDIYRNQEMNPMDKAVFWVEHVIKHKGAKHLKSRASKVPFYQYYLLDVISFILLIILFVILSVWIVIKIIKRLFKKEKIKIS